ncbi:DUF6221 family protein [Cellulomonas rhizosphaerae]|uniref:Uncharacterized protein n=1 Tax=Cellulomonas rhizosphaerae TaxID=2293719 RepID=A0A413RJF8_9CELL|nr:DUF6221 family protein [Cellulomonas rhizosphaerae]RHA38725.1 hypothetical protein D1825_13405 [Cellulomonas rhizosphaerae]
MLGIPVIVSALLPMEPTPGEDAVRIVRHGLRDILEWLGEDVGPAPGVPTHSVMSGDGTAHGPKVMFVFLLARIAEDEAVVREVQAKVGDRGYPGYYEHADGSAAAVYWDVDYRQGGYTVSAARVLAECEAKRAAVAEFVDAVDGGNGEGYMAERALRYLALPYADHPDYREEWRP